MSLEQILREKLGPAPRYITRAGEDLLFFERYSLKTNRSQRTLKCKDYGDPKELSSFHLFKDANWLSRHPYREVWAAYESLVENGLIHTENKEEARKVRVKIANTRYGTSIRWLRV